MIARLEAQQREQKRWEVLDRLARHGAAGQSIRTERFRVVEAYFGMAMAEEHKGKWAETFAGWMQNIVDSSETNALSAFMNAEAKRVLRERVKNVLIVLGVTN